jgi:hypothetical protein
VKTIVRGTINAGIKNIIYMGLISGPKIANGKCGKTTDAGTMDRGSTVLTLAKAQVRYPLMMTRAGRNM